MRRLQSYLKYVSFHLYFLSTDIFKTIKYSIKRV